LFTYGRGPARADRILAKGRRIAQASSGSAEAKREEAMYHKKALLVSSAVFAGAGIAILRARRKMNLNEKVVLITGGSRGLGLAVAREFASRGCHLILCARNREELQRAKNDLSNFPRKVLTISCDVTNPAQVAGCIQEGLAEFGRIDVLVNNAGVISVGPLHTMAPEDFEQAMDVMFWGTVHTTLSLLPHLRERRSGQIVNITSIGGKVSVPHLLPYSCAKFAATAFSEGLSAELRGTGIKVLTIAPGLMRTGSFVNAYFKGAEEGEAAWFGAASSFPGVSMSAKRAARQIAAAVERGRTECILSTPARLLAGFHALFPETAIATLGLVNHLLPAGSRKAEFGKDSDILRRPWMRAITVLGRKAAEEYLQPART
jgi:short-subunit dehydrogenase